jgi:phosphatidate cytidylyltransferase
MPNIAITSLGIIWIGLLGSFASLILRLSTDGSGFANAGTDTLLLVAICVVANDTAALFVGKSVGRTKLREWISPNKSVEGLIGGAVATIIAAIIIGSQSDTWNSLGEQLLLGIVIAIAAPLGDLVESMFKRNLDIKDFGNSIAGHGGVLDRFDAFLFVLPSVYYLTVVLEPWVS